MALLLKLARNSMRGCLLSLVGIVVAVPILLIGIFWLNFYDVHVHYRLTLEVQDGDQLKVGSSVIEAIYNVEPSWSWSGPNPHVRMVGFEPTVDLGEKGKLFLSFSNTRRTPAEIVERNNHVFCAADDMYCLPFEAYGKPGTGIAAHNYDRKVPLQLLLREDGPRDVPFASLPELVRFRDIEDWHTRTSASPYDLAASFGPSVALKRVVLQLTSDPITPLPEVWPQWLKQRHGGV